MTSSKSSTDWSAYWEGMADKRIFVVEAHDHVARLSAAVPLRPADYVLDFGCGFGHVVELLAPVVAKIDYWDAAETMRRATAERTKHLPSATVVDLSDTVPAAAEERYDLVLATSVIQYMQRGEVAEWLGRWRTMLRPGGRIVLSDVAPPGRSALGELAGMLMFAARHRFLVRALRDGVQEARRYTRSRSAVDLQRWRPAELAGAAAAAGLVAELLQTNLTHRRGRFSMVLRRG